MTRTEGVTGRPKVGAVRWLLGYLWALLRQRCPRCRRGRMYRGAFAMNDPCPECGLLFQREEGYFLGAMYASYVLSAALLLPAYFLVTAWRPQLAGIPLAIGLFILYLPFAPLVWRYSRVVWVYFERAVCPDDASAQPYERVRLKELEQQKPTGDDHPVSG